MELGESCLLAGLRHLLEAFADSCVSSTDKANAVVFWADDALWIRSRLAFFARQRSFLHPIAIQGWGCLPALEMLCRPDTSAVSTKCVWLAGPVPT